MKLAPAAVTRCVSAVNCSGADLASTAGAAACIGGSSVTAKASVGNVRAQKRAEILKQRIVMCTTIFKALEMAHRTIHRVRWFVKKPQDEAGDPLLIPKWDVSVAVSV